jgi:hypothetical protein
MQQQSTSGHHPGQNWQSEVDLDNLAPAHLGGPLGSEPLNHLNNNNMPANINEMLRKRQQTRNN